LLVRKGAAKGERFSVMSPIVNIGRAEYNDIRLPDPSVSATHVKLQLREGVWMLTDLGSTNGTSVDGQAVTEEAPLSPGTVITLGDVDLLFEPHDEGAGRARAAHAPPAIVEPAAVVPPSAAAPGPATAPVPAAGVGRPVARSGTVVLIVAVVVLLVALAALVFFP